MTQHKPHLFPNWVRETIAALGLIAFTLACIVLSNL